MKRHYIANGIAVKPLSSNPHAKYLRDKRLLDDKFSEAYAIQVRKITRLKRGKKKLENANSRANYIGKYLIGRVIHHISKGRDVGDIACREMVPVSRINEIISALPK